MKKKDEQWPPEWLIDLLEVDLPKLESKIGVKLLRKKDRVAVPFKCGSYGCIFFLEGDDTRILKITEDVHEGPYSAYVWMLQRSNVSTRRGLVSAVTVRIDGVWQISDDDERPVYVILEERVDPESDGIPELLIDGSDRYTDGWDKFMELREEEEKRRPSQKKIDALQIESDAFIEEGMKMMNRAGPKGRSVVEFLRMIHEDGKPLTDVHRGNLCVRMYDGPEGSGREKGQVVIIDFGVSMANSPFRRMIKRVL
jgi:hypothetical protein